MTDQALQPGRPQEASLINFQPGLPVLPRQIGMFPAFRAALLEDASREPGLSNGWRGRESEDFGVMLLEMMAYVADVASFYDQWIANEAYLRTATQITAARRLTGLIGYLPRPATAARVTLALALDGRLPVTVPSGTAFRSSAFDDEKPQVFTTTADQTVHPLRDRFTLKPQPSSTITRDGATVTFKRGTVSARTDDAVVIQSGSDHRARHVTAIDNVTDAGGYPVTRVTFDQSLPFLSGAAASAVKLLRPSATANVLVFTYSGNTFNLVMLDGVYSAIKNGDVILITRGEFVRWYIVTDVSTYTRTITPASSTNITSGTSTTITAKINNPAVTIQNTQIKLDIAVNANANTRRLDDDNTLWGLDSGANYTVHYGMTSAGLGRGEALETISDNDTLKVQERVENIPDSLQPSAFIVRDINQTAVAIGGTLATSGSLSLDGASGWEGELVAPVTLYGALIEAERGEQVTHELLGVGNAASPNQAFELKKFPLTFVDAPSSASTTGVASTLIVTVNNILWQEDERIYRRRADETIFTVRTDTDGKATITFGDGVRGARLPTGALVYADYRFGAGAAAPPANDITQIIKAVKGVSSQRNPLGAYGGSDAESESGLKTYAPKSALMFGRAVSLVDYQASAAGTSGVTSARASWAWSQTQQRPVVQVAYIGAGALGADILERLTAISAVGVPFQVINAEPRYVALHVTLEIDPLYVSDPVIAAVTDALNAALEPDVLGIGAILYRSSVLEIAAGVAGVVAPTNVYIDGYSFASAGIRAASDEYFNLDITVGIDAPTGKW